MRKPYKGNILLGWQNPGKKQTLRYIDGKEPPHYPVPAIRCVWDNWYDCSYFHNARLSAIALSQVRAKVGNHAR